MNSRKFAELVGIQPQSLRTRVAKHGHYFGVVPCRLPNGRLRYPDNALELLAKPQNLRGRSKS